jgi:hypothetical protein
MNVTKHYIHINKYGYACGPRITNKEECEADLAYVEFVVCADAERWFEKKIAGIAERMKSEYDQFDGIEVLAYVNELKSLVKKK